MNGFWFAVAWLIVIGAILWFAWRSRRAPKSPENYLLGIDEAPCGCITTVLGTRLPDGSRRINNINRVTCPAHTTPEENR